jgi:hypothetical protein
MVRDRGEVVFIALLIPFFKKYYQPMAGWSKDLGLSRLTRIIQDGSSRNRGVAKRDGRVEPLAAEAYLTQYVEAREGRARPPPCRNGESAIAAEVLMNNAG